MSPFLTANPDAPFDGTSCTQSFTTTPTLHRPFGVDKAIFRLILAHKVSFSRTPRHFDTMSTFSAEPYQTKPRAFVKQVARFDGSFKHPDHPIRCLYLSLHRGETACHTFILSLQGSRLTSNSTCIHPFYLSLAFTSIIYPNFQSSSPA